MKPDFAKRAQQQLTLKFIEIVKSKHPPHGFTEMWVNPVTGAQPKPGDCFFVPDEMNRAFHFSKTYLALDPPRPPIIIVLPSPHYDHGNWWCVDEAAHDGKQGWHGEGWKVSPADNRPPLSLPFITIVPSIRYETYHAQVARGVLIPYPDSGVKAK